MIAALAMFDSRAAFNPDVGTAPGDVGASWYPFWTAAVMGIAAALVTYRSFVVPQAKEGVFAERASAVAVLNLVIPMFAYALSFEWLGFYLATGLYMGFFAAYLGHYRFYWIIASAVITPLAIFLIFEVGFRLLLPKSVLYPGIPF
jgi:hypothetical protein